LIVTARPDAVICDVMMPVLDGRALCRAVQSDPSFHHVPVVLMSAVQNIVSRTDCKYAAYIQKPFDLDSILSTVSKVLEAGRE
jgi:CheY-like chemotaxis protein